VIDVSSVSFDTKGLVPAIIQNEVDGAVLMLGYMNQESLEQSLTLGRCVFWSRSRNKIWLKGETSGTFLDIVSFQIDCDRDALLIKVNPVGPTCHNGTISCFEDQTENDD
jgi:phosphoribosyl-ATP pyrophosphohydrolase/phosphoribosyl-AMP cyclohydrolase